MNLFGQFGVGGFLGGLELRPPLAQDLGDAAVLEARVLVPDNASMPLAEDEEGVHRAARVVRRLRAALPLLARLHPLPHHAQPLFHLKQTKLFSQCFFFILTTRILLRHTIVTEIKFRRALGEKTICFSLE